MAVLYSISPAYVDTVLLSPCVNVPFRNIVHSTHFALGAKAPYGPQNHRGFHKLPQWATLPPRQSKTPGSKSSIHLRRGVEPLWAHAMPLSAVHNSFSLCNNTEVCYNEKYDFYRVEK